HTSLRTFPTRRSSDLPLISPTEPVPSEHVKEDEHALERSMQFDFTNTDPWRVFRIMSEFVEGFDSLSHIPPAVAVFGSARVKPRSEEHTSELQSPYDL